MGRPVCRNCQEEGRDGCFQCTRPEPKHLSSSPPPRVPNIESYWTGPPPDESPRCGWWRQRIANGWQRNRRLRGLGYYESAEHFGVYIWEWLMVLSPMLNRNR